jgi:type IV pilus assembly protein PilQ
MKMYDITYAVMGRTIIVGKADSLGKTLGRESTTSYRIAYAKPKDVEKLVKELAGVSKVVVDERLRTIYVTGRDDQTNKIEKVIRMVDHPGRQIMLKARILEVSDTGKKDFESILNGVYNSWYANYSSSGLTIGNASANDKGKAVFDPDNDGRTIKPIGVDLEKMAGGAVHLLDAGINLLVSENKGKVLADPSVITIDGETATIKLVENYKYISERDDAGNPTYDEEEVGPQLECTPTIGRDGVITVKLSVKTGEVIGTYSGSQGEEFPQTSTREVETLVRVRNGEPFVIGGLDKESDTAEKNKVPILGDIPLLGELFKNTSHNKTKTEVAIIVIPYILETPDGPLEYGKL